ncbi:MAG: GAF domain-containing protein [Bacteroidales bacterium]|nr:GAF domain-containing protein [Bacteroidales bacterium]
MKHFEKGSRQIIIFLVIYIIISVFVGLSSFKYLQPKFINMNVLMGIYATFNIVVGILIYLYTRKHFEMAGSIENTYQFLSEEERKEKEQKEQEKMEKVMQERRKQEEEKKIAETVAAIAEPLADEIFSENYFNQLLINISKTINIVQGVAYILNRSNGKYEIKSTYAYYTTETNRTFELGEGIPGQVAKDQKVLQMDNVPEGYIQVVSGLGSSSPRNLIVIPIVSDEETIAILELASFEKPTVNIKEFYRQLNDKVSAKIAEILK